MGRHHCVETVSTQLIMVATKVLQRLLWILRYPSFTKTEQGLYRVGAIQTRLSEDKYSVACQIHYPTTTYKPQSSSVFTPYFRPNAILGLADYSKLPVSVLQYLQLRQHPCHINAEPIALFEEEVVLVPTASKANKEDETKTKLKKQFPVVLFSHGLGGCMEMYTQFCQQLSSYGYIVISLEHEDGSGAYAETMTKDFNDYGSISNTNAVALSTVHYKRPDNSPYSREKVVKFRQPFLQQRVHEINTIVDIVLDNSNKSSNKEERMDETETSTSPIVNPILERILQISDTSKGVSFIGHSFGGASMILATQQAVQQGKRIGKQPNSVVVFDPWCFALSDEVLQRGIGPIDQDTLNKNNIPILSILSENWAKTNPETKQIDYWLQNCNTEKISSHYIPNTSHSSISDASTWLPRFIGKRVYMCHTNEPKHVTIPFAAKVVAKQLFQALSIPSASETVVIPTNDNDDISSKETDYLKEYKYLPSPIATNCCSTSTTQQQEQAQPVLATTY